MGGMLSEGRQWEAPVPGGAEELRAFDTLQRRFPDMYRRVFSDPKQPRTVVVIPSLSLDWRELERITGAVHYEERMLCLLMLLRMPRTEIVYLTSLPIDPAIIDYYLHLLPGVPTAHAARRLTMISVEDPSPTPLTQKILARPAIVDRIDAAIRYPDAAHMTCFVSTGLERTLAVRLGTPLYAPDPSLAVLGEKTAGRTVLRAAGLDVPPGFEDLRDVDDLVRAISDLHHLEPSTGSVVVKLNDGFSGEGNAVLSLERLSEASDVHAEVRRRLETDLRCVATDETPAEFLEALAGVGGIVEAYVEGLDKTSPSVQLRIDPLGEIQLVSTHDQVLGGASGQVFLGCSFPADDSYRLDLHEAGAAVGAELRSRGVLGRFAVDFVSVNDGQRWRHHAIEINLRKGGTTLPYLMLQFLTDGTYERDTGTFRTPAGEARSYYATDNIVRESFVGLSPTELIDLTVVDDLHYDAAGQEGVVLHLMGSVTDHGKIGMVSIARDLSVARSRYEEAVLSLERSARER